MPTVLVADLGSTSFRAALIDAAGFTTERVAMPMAAGVDPDGRSEADPEAWWQALTAAADRLAASEPHGLADVEAVAISAFTRTQVLVDAGERVVRPAILWGDTRAESRLAELKRLAPDGHPEAAQLSAFHPLARLWWLKAEEPAALKRARHVLEPKDYLNMRLTGRVAGDQVSMARLAAAAAPGPSSGSLLEAAGLAPGLLPPLEPPVSIMGHVRSGLAGALAALAGRPVIAMANDTWASVVGLGAMRLGCAYNLSGTTEVLGLLTGRPAAADGLITIGWQDRLWQIGGPSLAGGDTLRWLLELVGELDGCPAAVSAALDRLLARPRDREPVLFLPFLQGERVPFWDPSLRGAMVGLNRRHGAGDLAWAALEGIACLNRLVLERAEAAAGERAQEVRFGGGGAANARWAQVKADMLDRPVAVVDQTEPGLSGAAITAWTALGRQADLASAQAGLVKVTRRHLPDASRRAASDALFKRFIEAQALLTPRP
jgi:xylulokinase